MFVIQVRNITVALLNCQIILSVFVDNTEKGKLRRYLKILGNKMDLCDYIKTFCGTQNYDNGIFPGEHHFVSLCLVPAILKRIQQKDVSKIRYVNPDGSKGQKDKIPLYDITFDQKGLEVKYSRSMRIEFTTCQLKMFSSESGRKNLCGVLALVNVEGEAKVMWLDWNKFLKKYDHEIRTNIKKAEDKMANYFETKGKKKSHNIDVSFDCKDSDWIDVKSLDDFFILSGLINLSETKLKCAV